MLKIVSILKTEYVFAFAESTIDEITYEIPRITNVITTINKHVSIILALMP